MAKLQRDSRASLIVHNQVGYLHYAAIRGTATLVDEGETALADVMRLAADSRELKGDSGTRMVIRQ